MSYGRRIYRIAETVMQDDTDIAADAEVVRLDDLGLAELRAVWTEKLGNAPILASAEVTRRWLAWEFQAAKLGGFDSATRRRLRQLARSAKVEPSESETGEITVKPGTVLAREWSGTTHRVTVLEQGFSWNGQAWRSLSEIATRITGTRWSGPRFFGLKRRHRA